jgi:hypothetical protein
MKSIKIRLLLLGILVLIISGGLFIHFGSKPENHLGSTLVLYIIWAFTGILMIIYGIVKEGDGFFQSILVWTNAPSPTILFLFVPGYKFTSETSNKIKKGNNKGEAYKLLFIIFFLVVFGALKFPAESFFRFQNGWDEIYFKGEFDIVNFWNIIAFQGVTILVYVLYSVLINILVLWAYLFSYKLDIKESLYDIKNYFNISDNTSHEMGSSDNFWPIFTNNVNNIFGHQLYSGNNTLNLLRKLEEDTRLGTTRWFLVKFAAEVLERNISPNRIIEYTYPQAKDYSIFLDQTLHYSTKSVQWIVDPNDLNEIFGVFVNEATIILYELYFGLQIGIDDISLNNNTFHFHREIPKRSGFQDFELNIDIPDEDLLNPWLAVYLIFQHNLYSSTYKEFDFKRRLTKMRENVQKRGTIIKIYPHINRFYNVHVPKNRIFILKSMEDSALNLKDPDIKNMLHYGDMNFFKLLAETILQEKVESDNIDEISHLIIKKYYEINLKCYKTRVKNRQISPVEFSNLDSKKVISKQIFLIALKLLEQFCGSPNNQIVINNSGFINYSDIENKLQEILNKSDNGFSEILKCEETGAIYLDIGIYDKSVFVHSCRKYNNVGNNTGNTINDSRIVKWGILEDLHEDLPAFFQAFDPESVLEYERFFVSLADVNNKING